MLDTVNRLLRSMIFHTSEVEIYKLLLQKGGMTVSEIARELQLSTRIVRTRLKRMLEEGIVKRKLIQRGWVGYVYFAERPERVAEIIKLRLAKAIHTIDKEVKG
ncbi:winged helix-turn-helix transcriptional regulator [Archaeoglobus veneficus]|uniref:Transcriptional regulator, TrmB n=1 Tax=Archaeoglobus veneficus (strain DSM 11195 / SNP6) TaxID=693661 RepID=F2KQ63_ARCVS|nr:transcriptional regulator [Archaeoglobus veneficus]AEA47666.1 transcriptional regulator, TrmB [Archaeoglobus veneficus SNP6]